MVTSRIDSTTEVKSQIGDIVVGQGFSHVCYMNTGPSHGVITHLSATKNFKFKLRVSSEEDTGHLWS